MAKKAKQVNRSQEEKREVARAIFAQYAKGLSSLDSCAKANKVGIRTLYEWCDEDAEIARMKKNAQDELKCPNLDELKIRARVSLSKLVEGYDYEEKTVDVETDAAGHIKGQKVRKVTKHRDPDTTAVIFALKNTDPEHFNRGPNDLNANVITGGEITINSLAANITPEILEASVKARREHFAQIRKRAEANG